jgi:hypothetical protein
VNRAAGWQLFKSVFLDADAVRHFQKLLNLVIVDDQHQRLPFSWRGTVLCLPRYRPMWIKRGTGGIFVNSIRRGLITVILSCDRNPAIAAMEPSSP